MTVDERAESHDIGDLYLFTAQDQDTRLIAYRLLGKRSADNTRRFMVRLADRMAGPERGIPQISADEWPAYPEAVDLGFGHNVKLGILIKEYRSSRM